MATTWLGLMGQLHLVFPNQLVWLRHLSSPAWAWVVLRCTTITNTREGLKEEITMLAVCFTR